MSDRTRLRYLAWLPLAVSVALLCAATVVGWAEGVDVEWMLFPPVGLAFPIVGSFLAWRRPHLVIGWLLALWGVVINLAVFAGDYIERGQAEPGMLPGVEWVGWGVATVWHPAFALLAFLLLLFPDGQFTSARWRRFGYFVVAIYLALAIATALSPQALEVYYPGLDSPLPIEDYRVAAGIQGTLLVGQLLVLVTAMVALVLRLRRSRGEERRQIQWFVYAVVLAVATFVVSIAVLGAGYLFPIFGIIPVAAAIAVLRYRLYDIDRIINRSLVYGLLTIGLGATYFGLVVGLQGLLRPVSGGSDFAIVVTTLVVAALFLPARSRVQRAVDRRFNRRSYDAARTIEAFSTRLREQIELDTLREELLAVTDKTMAPARTSLWLRSSEWNAGGGA